MNDDLNLCLDLHAEHIEHPLWSKPVLVFDTETTGLDPRKHEVIELGALTCSSPEEFIRDDMRWRVHEKHHFLFRMCRPHEADPEALRINGFQHRLDELKVSKSIAEQEADVRKIFHGKTCLAQFAGFDIMMLNASLAMFRLPQLRVRAIDLRTLAWLLLPVERLGLDDVLRSFGTTPGEGRHTSLEDSRLTASAFYSTLKFYLEDRG